MIDKRQNDGARRSERQDNKPTLIAGLWVDYHGTAVQRKPGAAKLAAVKALEQRVRESDGRVDAMIERARLEIDREQAGQDIDGHESWRAINMRAFAKYGCTEAQARLMSDLIRDERNYVASERRRKFIGWLLKMFPSKNAEGRYVLTASNAFFTTISRYIEENGLHGVRAVSADLINVYKPRMEFFQRLVGVTGVPPEQTLFVCNSWRNDSRAAHLGVNCVIILPSSVTVSNNVIMERIGATKGRVFLVRSLRAAREIIERNFVRIR